jgi:TetR/AcrR family transcriptional regulator
MPTISSKINPRGNSSRDAEQTKAKILDAAEAEFAVSGLMATRTEAIAAQTGVTKAMIYYYFQSKEKLYQAVLGRCFNDAMETMKNLQLDRLPPEIALEKLVEEMLYHMAANPNMGSILSLEAIQNKGKYYPKQIADTLYGTLATILQQGMETGVFRQLDPKHTAVNIVGTCSFYYCAHENLKHLWPGKRLLGKELLNRHGREAIDLIMAGVRNIDRV